MDASLQLLKKKYNNAQVGNIKVQMFRNSRFFSICQHIGNSKDVSVRKKYVQIF